MQSYKEFFKSAKEKPYNCYTAYIWEQKDGHLITLQRFTEICLHFVKIPSRESAIVMNFPENAFIYAILGKAVTL